MNTFPVASRLTNECKSRSSFVPSTEKARRPGRTPSPGHAVVMKIDLSQEHNGISPSFRADEVGPPADNAILLIRRVEASEPIKSKWQARRGYFAGAFLSLFKAALIARENAPAYIYALSHAR